MDGAILGNQVPLLVTLRRPIYFDYEIEFIDANGAAVLATVKGEKGKTSFSYNLEVYRNTEVQARFKIGDITGPESKEALTVNVETTGMLIISHTIKIFIKLLVFK